jgi:hypothetical protein
MYPPIVAKQRLDKSVTMATNTHTTEELLVLYSVRVVSQENRRSVLPRTSCFLNVLHFCRLFNDAFSIESKKCRNLLQCPFFVLICICKENKFLIEAVVVR